MKCLLTFILIAIFLASCNHAQDLELVMKAGERITATTSVGTIEILAGDGLTRVYKWEGESRSVTLFPRKRRWKGSLGAYYPGPEDHWEEHHGITRGVLQEGQQRFNSLDDAVAWLKEQEAAYPTVHNSSGLVVSFGKNLEREQINVEVWQILIDGSPPDRLVESTDQAIKRFLIDDKVK